jgi:hypothetical protein
MKFLQDRNAKTILSKKTPDMVIPEMPESKKNRHPEQLPTEVFMGNTVRYYSWHDNWYSLRLGNVAYDNSNNPIENIASTFMSDDNLFPMFVSWEEYCVNKILFGDDPCEKDGISG